MNIPLSLILYNPIEAIFLFYICNLLSDNKIPLLELIKKNWLNIICVSTLLLAIQWIPSAYPQVLWYLGSSIVISRILSPILLYTFYNKYDNISLLKCFFIFILYSTTTTIIVTVFNFGITPNFNIGVEFFGNIFIKVLQILVANILNEVYRMIKKLILKVFDNNTNNSPAFTDLEWYAKKMPEEMKKEIESK